MREAVGADVDLAVDCHGAFDVAASLRLGAALAPYELLWIEDPVPSGNVRALAKVTQGTTTPICTGELLNTRYEFRELFEQQAADIIMPDLARTGGVMEMKKIAAAADTYYIPVAPHNMVGPVATLASAQLCACIPNNLVLEYQLGDVPWVDDLLTVPLDVHGRRGGAAHGARTRSRPQPSGRRALPRGPDRGLVIRSPPRRGMPRAGDWGNRFSIHLCVRAGSGGTFCQSGSRMNLTPSRRASLAAGTKSLSSETRTMILACFFSVIEAMSSPIRISTPFWRK